MKKNKFVKFFVAALLTIATSFVVVTPAYAHDDVITNCVGPGFDTYNYTTQEGGYWYSEGFNVPSSSCHNISIGAHESGAFTVRIRFYPSGGGNYANSWKSVCQFCWVTAAHDVLNGTHFRVETLQYEDLSLYY